MDKLLIFGFISFILCLYGLSDFSFDELGALIPWIIILVTIAGIIISKFQKRKLLNQFKTVNIEVIKNIIPDFDEKKFEIQISKLYKKIQKAETSFDEEELRICLTDELYNMYISQIEMLKQKKQKKVVKALDFHNFKIIDVRKENNNVIITINLLISCIEYITDKKNNFISGNNGDTLFKNCNITFIKNDNDNEINKYCPNCGAEITNSASNKCKYCDSIIISNKHDWVMSKQELIEQYYDYELK
ncbi:MAG: hypothetical protein E7157_01745 [Lactobacillales bacterium]|nr:hypothetical protein [Lactobacillales bacterium]